MSGRVMVRYCSAPARLLKVVASEMSVPSVADVFGFVSAGVGTALQLAISARSRSSSAY
jgi:hypothetical protein